MKERGIRIILAIALFAGLLTGCSGAQKKTVRLTVKVPTLTMTPANDTEIIESYEFLEKAAAAFEEQYKDADVEVDVVCFPITEEKTAITDCFDTPDAADVLYEGYFNMATYIYSGRVVPLDDIISDELRADIDDASWAQSRVDGKTYMMPFLALQNILGYNKELFRQAGLEAYISDDPVIQSWTLEEWEKILSALHEKLPENTFPMMMYAKNDQGDTHVMLYIRNRGSEFFDGQGRFNLSTPEGIAGLQWIKDSYDKGYFPTHCENLEISDNITLFSKGQLALQIMNNSLIPNMPQLDMGYVNFPGPGDGFSTSWVTGFQVFDNGDEAKVKAAKDFVKFIYENETWLDYSSAGIPVSASVAEKYKDQILLLEQFYQNSANAVDFMANNPNWRGVREVFYPHIQDLLRGDKTAEEVAQALDTDCNAAIDAGRADGKLHE